MMEQLTNSQKKGVTITDRDLCIVAGPGSGKTRVLVERFVNLVISGNASTNEILTLTFTEKAANEMKVRVARSFESKGMEKERQEIEFAYLSTIHSFCARLLRENAIEAGIDPQYRVLVELEAGRLKEQVLETILKEWQDRDRLDTFLNDIYWQQTDAKRSRFKSFKESLINIHDEIRNACQPMSDIVNTSNILQDIVEHYNSLNGLIKNLKEICTEKKLTEKTGNKVNGILERWNCPSLQENINKLCDKKEDLAKEGGLNLLILQEIKAIKSLAKGNVSKDVKQSLNDMQKELEYFAALIIEDYSTGSKKVLSEFLVDFDVAYKEKKRAESFLDFTDLEEKTIELLNENDHIAQEIKQKFKYILVDEFQDTNKLQMSIISLIRGSDNLFIVGDAKQSIYGFRNADVGIFQGLQKESSPNSLIYLNENFRSRPQILEFINYIFDNIWQVNPNGPNDTLHTKSGEDLSLKAGAMFSQKHVPSIEIIMAAGRDKAEARKWESIEIAKRIKEIVEKDELEITSKNEHNRKISYGDFAVLFRSTSDIKLYERSLDDFDVPYYVVSGRGFFNTTEITDLINMLKVIEFPLDEINMASVLKSPFVGINDEELFWLAEYAHNKSGNDERRYLYQVLDKVETIKEICHGSRDKIARFLQILNEIQSIKPRISLWQLISYVLKKTGFQSKMLLFQNGKRKYANLLKMIELCRSREEFGPITLRDFIEIAEDHKFREVRESEAPVESEDEDVVKLTTVHAAKGLEYPVVIVADIDRVKTRQSDHFAYSKEHGVSFKILDPLTNETETPLSYKKTNDEIEEKELRESKRLFYVAMTRAQEHLIISAGISKNKDGEGKIRGDWLQDVHSVLEFNMDLNENPGLMGYNGDGQKLRFTAITEESGPSKGSARKRLLVQYKKEIDACSQIKTGPPTKEIINIGTNILSAVKHTMPADYSHYVYSVTEILKFHYCPQLYYLTYVLGLRGMAAGSKGVYGTRGPSSLESEDDIDTHHDDEIPGNELGNIAHQVFNRYNLSEGQKVLREIIKCEFESSGFETDQSEIERVANWVNAFYESDVGKEAASGSSQKRETSFIFKHRDNLIRGQIDLFFFNKAGNIKIIDYKTNDITAEEIPEKTKYYQLQMQLYAKALEAIYEKKVEETILYFLVPNKHIIVDTTEEFIKELYQTLDDFFATHKKGDFKKASNHKCEWCEFEKVCI